MNQLTEPRRAWQYAPGARRVRRAPNVGYDNPSTASDGLRTNDQLDAFNGATDRYTWKLLGKREMYVPYNAYRAHSDRVRYRDLILQNHLNQDVARYELHRVWIVESQLRPGTTHIYKRRTFFIDEDTWQIVLVDCYDAHGVLWRWQEIQGYEAYDKPYWALPAIEIVYDLQNGRYLAYSMNNEEPENVERQFPLEYFDPSNLSSVAAK
jgi:hypothetical protein